MDTILASLGQSVKYFVQVDSIEHYDPRPFLEWIRPQMKRREWNGSDLARKMGLQPGTVARWLRGERRPDTRSCDLLADAFGVDVDLVLSLVGHRPREDKTDPDDQLARIVALLNRVDLAPGARGPALEMMLRTWIESDREERARQAAEVES